MQIKINFNDRYSQAGTYHNLGGVAEEQLDLFWHTISIISERTTPMSTKGIFCLEGLWEPKLTDKSTVLPLLQLLEANSGIKFIHRDCATVEELEFYLKKWGQAAYNAYPILYLAFHGEAGEIWVDKKYSIDQLAESLSGTCERSIIYFGSCSTLDVDKRHLKRFLKQTNALAVCGYKNEVDWMRSAAFDLLAFGAMQENEFSGRGIRAIQRKISEGYASLANELKFRMVTRLE